MPSWVTQGHLAVLTSGSDIDHDNNSTHSMSKSTCEVIQAMSTKQPPKHPNHTPYRHRQHWERHLPQRLTVAAISNTRSLNIQIELTSTDNSTKILTMAMVDSGATHMGYVDADFVQENEIPTRRLQRPIPVHNVDGTLNEAGSITEIIDTVMGYNSHSERIQLAVTKLGNHSVILGLGWLRMHNPEINWDSGEIKLTRCHSRCATCCKQTRQERAHRISALRHQKRSYRRCREGPFPRVVELEESEEDELYNLELIDTKNPEDFPEDIELREGDHIPTAPTALGLRSIAATETTSSRLAQAYTKPPQDPDELVPAHLHNYMEVFSKESFDTLPESKPWDHAIELVSDPTPTNCKVYPLAPTEQTALDIFIQENLSTGRIRPSKSPYASPVFFVKKKDGSLRLVQDYRALNNITVKNRYPLPLINELINQLKGAQLFTKLDVRWGFNNVRIREGDEWKAAFRTNRGLFEPLVMFFGLTNSPATFQTMMNDILHDLIMQGAVSVYLDDILIFTKTVEDHRRITCEVLERLRQYKLYLRPEKCEFEKTRIEYLGVIISHNHIEMDPAKVSGVAEWPVPQNKKDVLSFLGFTNFYRRFIEGFSHHARPLFELTKKDARFSWSLEAASAFKTLQTSIVSSPILALPDDSRPYRLEADSSNFATGAVLSQESQDDGKWHPIAFYSKSLNPVERNYEIHDKEMLAIIRALEEWRHFLEGGQHPVEIWTDHKNLEYFRSAKKLNRRQARWSLFLSRFDFHLHHRPGYSMGKPDALSRRADHGTGQDDNNNVTLLRPELFVIAALSEMKVTGEEVEILRDIRFSLRSKEELEEPVMRAVLELRKSCTRSVRSAEWGEQNGLLLFRGKVYVPPTHDLRRRIIAQHHDLKISGHPGRFKTLELISRNYWWPQMSRLVGQYTAHCDLCLRTKTRRHLPTGELIPSASPSEPWEAISVDFIVELPEAHGYDAILVVVCMLGKRAHFLRTHTTITAEGTARLYLNEVWKHHGMPRSIRSDRGPQFVADFTRELCRLAGVKQETSTAYHPQTDGQTERVNQELEQFIRLFVSERQDDWDELLPVGEFSYNNHIHSSTQQTPFMVDIGRNPRMGFEPNIHSSLESVNKFVERLKAGWSEAQAALTKAKDDYARYYNQRHTPAPTFQPGDRVWLDSSDITTTRPSKKLSHHWWGPYTVVKEVGKGAYKLKLPPSMKRLHPVFPVVKLELAKPDPISGRTVPHRPEPEVIDGEPEYAVDQILDSRIWRRKLQYKVRWEGYGPEDDSWEPATGMRHAQGAVEEFHRQHPEAPHHIKLLSTESLSHNWRLRRAVVP